MSPSPCSFVFLQGCLHHTFTFKDGRIFAMRSITKPMRDLWSFCTKKSMGLEDDISFWGTSGLFLEGYVGF